MRLGKTMRDLGSWLVRTLQNISTSSAKKPRTLFLYSQALLRMASNSSTDGYSQGQVAVYWLTNSDSSIDILLAPPGTVDVPYHCKSSDKFIAFDWRWLTLSKQISFNHHFMEITCHRTQFPVRNYIVMTVHKCMGGELPKLLTRISLVDSEYCLWEGSQLYVLFSRVHRLSDNVPGRHRCNNTGYSAFFNHEASICSVYREHNVIRSQ